MSTLKTIYLQHLNGANTNATLDANGNMTVTGTVCGASSNMFRNRIINGNMVIDQRNAGASVTATNASPYTVDRWYAYGSVTSKFTVQQNAGSVTPPAGFTYYIGATSSSAYTVGTGEFFYIAQPVEGYNVADFDFGKSTAKTVTLSFWVRSSLTGTFGASLYKDGTRNYPFNYTISSANTWTYITVTIPGDTTASTYNTTNGAGLYVIFGLGCGTTYGSGTAGTWNNGNNLVPSNSVSVVSLPPSMNIDLRIWLLLCLWQA